MPGHGRSGGLLLALMLLGLAPPACRAPLQRYDRWLAAGNAHRVAAYTRYLRAAGVADVVPMPQLLRRGRRWRLCGGTEFAVPDSTQWAAIVPTLRLVRDLRAPGWLRGARVVSAWRDPAFNGCEGGSPGSKHLANNALDIEFDGGSMRQLCAYWRAQGSGRAFGLGFYAATKIHVDTSGFRTWGRDFHRGSSLCVGDAGGAQRRGR